MSLGRLWQLRSRQVGRIALTIAGLGVLMAVPEGQGQSQAPTFRSRIDLMQLDVSVLDKQGRPVRGLTQADFTLLEDNKLQTIEGFTAVDMPDAVAKGPARADRVTPDVTTNEIDNRRIFVIILDDGLGLGGGRTVWGIREMQRAATIFVNALGENDLAAVLFTGTNYKKNQNLTSDHAKLIKALMSYPPQDRNLVLEVIQPPPPKGRSADQKLGECLARKELLHLVDSVVTHLSGLRDRRKSIIYFGSGMPWADVPEADACGTYWLWRDVFASAQSANVAINPVDTGGCCAVRDQYLAVAENTGGKAVTGSNDFVPGLREVLVRNSSYYLLAYQPTRGIEDGTFRHLTVKVNRPDVEVIARRNYWAPRAKPADEAVPPPSPQVEALAGVLPLSALPLRASAAPFSVPGTSRTVVALAVGVRQPAVANRSQETVELLITAFTADGDPTGNDTQTIPMTIPAALAGRDVSRYDVLARIELPKPGKYELRLSVHSDLSDTRGSIYLDVDAPDFRKEKIALSGVALTNAGSSTPVAPARVLRDLMPITPTTERSFAKTDLVSAFLRVYQADKPVAIPMKVKIQDAAGNTVAETTETIAPDRFVAGESAEFQFRLPLSTLTAGEYLLTFEATAGKAVSKRDVRFDVR